MLKFNPQIHITGTTNVHIIQDLIPQFILQKLLYFYILHIKAQLMIHITIYVVMRGWI